MPVVSAGVRSRFGHLAWVLAALSILMAVSVSFVHFRETAAGSATLSLPDRAAAKHPLHNVPAVARWEIRSVHRNWRTNIRRGTRDTVDS
jgi:hypothetical protein